MDVLIWDSTAWYDGVTVTHLMRPTPDYCFQRYVSVCGFYWRDSLSRVVVGELGRRCQYCTARGPVGGATP